MHLETRVKKSQTPKPYEEPRVNSTPTNNYYSILTEDDDKLELQKEIGPVLTTNFPSPTIILYDDTELENHNNNKNLNIR